MSCLQHQLSASPNNACVGSSKLQCMLQTHIRPLIEAAMSANRWRDGNEVGWHFESKEGHENLLHVAEI